MPRMPLRPALRAYAHAPAGAEEFTPASISGTLLWIDPDDASTWTGATAIEDKVSSASFVHSGAAVTRALVVDSVAGSLGNGKYFIHADLASAYGSAYFTHVASGGDLADANVGGLGEEWLWYRVGWNDSGNKWERGQSVIRGISSAAAIESWTERAGGGSTNTWIRPSSDKEWSTSSSDTLGPTYNSTTVAPPFVSASGQITVVYLLSFDDGGTKKIRVSCDGGVNWIGETTYGGPWNHGLTANPSAITSTENKWTLSLKNWGIANPCAIGEAGFINGSVSASDLATLHAYLKAKWDLTDS